MYISVFDMGTVDVKDSLTSIDYKIINAILLVDKIKKACSGGYAFAKANEVN